MSVIGELSVPVTPVTGRRCDMTDTTRPWWTVADAAALLRVHTDTLYDAINAGTFPAKRVGDMWKIPCEALRLTYKPPVWPYRAPVKDEELQLAIPLDPNCLVPIRRYLDGQPKHPWDYEHALWRVKADKPGPI